MEKCPNCEKEFYWRTSAGNVSEAVRSCCGSVAHVSQEPPEFQGCSHPNFDGVTDGVNGLPRSGRVLTKRIATIKILDGARVIRIDAPIETGDAGLLFAGLKAAADEYLLPGRVLESIYFHTEESF